MTSAPDPPPAGGRPRRIELVRAGLTDTAIAGMWAILGYRDLASAQPTPPAHQRRRDQLARIVLGAVPVGARLLQRVAAERRQPIGADRDGAPHDVAG